MPFDVPIDEVVVELQHAECGVLVDEDAYVKGQGVFQYLFIQCYLVCVVGDDIMLSEPFVVD